MVRELTLQGLIRNDGCFSEKSPLLCTAYGKDIAKSRQVGQRHITVGRFESIPQASAVYKKDEIVTTTNIVDGF